MIDSLNFAMGFPVTKDLIINLLRVADGNIRSIEELNENTAMPGGDSTGKLKPHLDYAIAMGVLKQEKYKGNILLRRTALGEKIMMEDLSIEEELTLQLLNYNITSNLCGSLLWNIIVRQLPINNVLPYATLKKYLEIKHNKSEKSARKIISPFVSSQEGIFQSINFISRNKESITIKSLKINRRYAFMYAYTLLSDWDAIFANEPEISFENVRDTLQWGAGFGWNEDVIFTVLQLCEDYGAIKLNKQLVPMTIVRNISADEALDKLYDLL